MNKCYCGEGRCTTVYDTAVVDAINSAAKLLTALGTLRDMMTEEEPYTKKMLTKHRVELRVLLNNLKNL